jgi:2-polyprenyl-6-methoxyphenol hydroxylase-like FAD-dependent oxidoreductase
MVTTPTVLVVGAGPVGLVAACELARRGVGVRIIDKLTTPAPESRALAVHARSLDMLAQMGVADELIATGLKCGAMQMYSGHQKLFRIPLDSVDAAYPFSLNTPQSETERVLTAHLASLGVTIERGVELTALTQGSAEVRGTLQHRDGTTEETTADWVIGTDGAHSVVRQLVGDKLEGTFVGEHFLLGDVQVDYDAEHTIDAATMYTFFSPAGPVLVLPFRSGRARVMAQIHPEDSLDQENLLAELQKIVDARVGGISVSQPHWLTSFELRHALVRQYRHGRVFLAGDAAHIHSPAGGQGMNTGMQDAFNLAWKLAAVIDGHAGDGLLESYQAERRPIAESVITFSDRLSKAGTLRGAAQHVRNALLMVVSHIGPALRAMAEITSENTVSYPHSPLAVGPAPRGAKVAAGAHFPYLGETDVQHQLSRTFDTGHTTVTVASGNIPPPGTVGRQVLITDTDAPVAGYDVVIADPKQVAAQRLGLDSGGRVVVRPDGYLGTITTVDDHRTVDEYFAAVAR